MMNRHTFNFSFQEDCSSDNEEKYGNTPEGCQKVEEKFKVKIKNEPLDSFDQKLETDKALDIKRKKELKASSIQTIGQNQEHPHVQSKVHIKKSKKNVKRRTLSRSQLIKLKNAKEKVVPCLFCSRVFFTENGLSKHLSTVTSILLPHPSEAEMEEAKQRGFYKCNVCYSKLPLIIGGDKMGQHLKRCRSEYVGNNLPRFNSNRPQYQMSERPQPLMDIDVPMFQAPISQPTFSFLQTPAPFRQFPLNYSNVSEPQFPLSSGAHSMRKNLKFDLDPRQILDHNNQDTSFNNNTISDEILQMERIRQKQVDKMKAEEENMRKIDTMIALKRKEQHPIEGVRVAHSRHDLRGEQKQLRLDKLDRAWIERERKDLNLERKKLEDQRKIQELQQSIMDQVVKIRPGYHGRSVKERLGLEETSERYDNHERYDKHVFGSGGKIAGGVVNTESKKKGKKKKKI